MSTYCCCTDPPIVVEVQWPDGTYSLPQARDGCPVEGMGWYSGWAYQDNEDYKNQNSRYPANLSKHIKLIDIDQNHKINYCTQAVFCDSGFMWPKDNYCIARYGGKCPLGFLI